MKLDAAALPQRARSGWVPTGLAVVATVIILLANEVPAGDVARFAAYCVLGVVLPGLVLWRLLVHRAGSTLLADAAFGASLALAVELAVYVFCAHFDHPGLARVWPLVPLGLMLVPACRRLVWRRAEAQPVWWSWGMSALMVMALFVLNRVAWAIAPLTSEGLRKPYVDFPYHLSLVSGLSRHVKTDLPFAQGEPLYYHWFNHAHVAAERHATGVEPFLLMSRLDMVLIVGIVLLGSAMLAQRVARSPLAGFVAAGVLTMGGSALIWPHFTPIFLTASTYISPTTAFACAVLVGCAAISVELLDPEARPPATAWIAAVLLIVASSGAKGPALPVLLAGYVSLLLMGLLLRRGVNWTALILTAFGAVVFLVAQKVIYGGTAQGTGLVPFGIGNYIAKDFGLLEQPSGGSLGLRTTTGGLYLLIRISCLVAVVGLFTPRVWRNPLAHFVVGCIVGGVGAMSLLDSATRNQIYFLLVTPVFVAVATGWGLVELLRRVSTPLAARVCLGFLVAGIALSGVLLMLRPEAYDGDDGVSLPWLVAQPLVVVGILVLVAVALVLVARRRHSWRHAAPLACASMAIGLGLLSGPVYALDLDSRITGSVALSRFPEPQIAPGGISAAQWLRDHSPSDAVVATNSHCVFPAPVRCDHRAFWISAYVERQILVEGWSYTSRSAKEAKEKGSTVPFVPYWKRDLLVTNERAFWKPTRERLDELKRRYHVTWLFVDKRFRADLPGLRRLADLRHENANYAVFQLR